MKTLRSLTTLLAVAFGGLALILRCGVATSEGQRRILVASGALSLALLAGRIGLTIFGPTAGRAPPLRLALPLLLLLQGMGALIGFSHLRGPVLVAIATVEAVVVIVVVVGLIRDKNPSHSTLEDRIAGKLIVLLPAPLARLVGIEVLILSAVLHAPSSRAPRSSGQLTFSYSETSSLRILAMAGPLLLLFEGIVVQQLLGSRHPWLRLAHVAGCAYAVIWIWGAYLVMKSRPHVLAGGELSVNRGPWGNVRIPLSEIVGTEPIEPMHNARVPGAVSFTIKGPEQVQLSLRSPVRPMGFLKPGQPASTLIVSADSASGLCAALSSATGGRGPRDLCPGAI
jgi:hypothetical protein